MRIYFVRHGESEENTTHVYLGSPAKLTETGYQQARFVAERFLKIPVDLILSSTMVRARETARIISEKVGQTVAHSDLLQETIAPSELLALPYDDPEAVRVRTAWLASRFIDEHFRFSDEENVSDLKKRAQQALDFIIDHKVDDILVVTHGTFLRVMVGVMLHGGEWMPQQFQRMRAVFAHSNTGITVCEYNEEHEEGERAELPQESQPGSAHGWRLITWNDHAHLG